jgi:predicted metalloenzyme YecM
MQDLAMFFQAAERALLRFQVWAEPFAETAQADHVCFKCASSGEYEAIRRLFEPESVFVYQSIISKRRIAVIKFLRPLASVLGDIWFLELSDQKPDQSQVSGFDHVEIYPRQGSVERLATQLEATGVRFEKVVRPHHTTFDADIGEGFRVRLEEERLVEKISREEFC